MKRYKVDYSYTAPFWGDIEVEGVSTEDARQVAQDDLDISFPEAIEMTIYKVEEIKVVS